MKIHNFSGKLERLLKARGMTQAQLADKAAVTERHISRVKNAEEVPEPFLKKICAALNVDLSEFGDLSVYNGDYFAVPFREAGGAMGEGCFIGSKKIISHISLRRDFLLTKTSNLEALSFIHAAGESMSPTIPPDAAVLIDESQKEPINHKIYYIMLNGLYLIKRLEVKNGRTTAIISDNNFEKREILADDHFEILGRAILQQSEL